MTPTWQDIGFDLAPTTGVVDQFAAATAAARTVGLQNIARATLLRTTIATIGEKLHVRINRLTSEEEDRPTTAATTSRIAMAVTGIRTVAATGLNDSATAHRNGDGV